ncbi:hypothetical protein [Streptomyces sp. NPDC005485]|uniref:hypothetical protein n=1 Tax=Streptomyces sp. NPDC005485 TaxID=3155591 RepID=UPI0033A2D511
MRSTRRIAPPVLLTCLLLAGCSSVPLGTSTSSESQSPAAGASGTAGAAIG